MRMVPRSPSLKLTPLICSTNWGRSVDGGYRGKPNGNHSAARPSFPAIAVNVPHSWTVRSGSVCSSAVQPASETTNSPHANKRGSQDLSEKRIALCSCHRLLNVITVCAIGARQGDQGSREFHFRIGAAQADCFSHPAISVQASRRVGRALPQPLLVSLGQVADVEPREGVGVSSGI